MTQVVESHCPMSRFGKQFRNCTTYVPSTAGDQDLHKKAVLSGAVWFTLSLTGWQGWDAGMDPA
jgi:hypothetical protein